MSYLPNFNFTHYTRIILQERFLLLCDIYIGVSEIAKRDPCRAGGTDSGV